MTASPKAKDLAMSALRKPQPRSPQAIVITEPSVHGDMLGLDESESPVISIPPTALAYLAADPGFAVLLKHLLRFVASDPRRIEALQVVLENLAGTTATGTASTLRLSISPQDGALEVVPLAADRPPSPAMARALARGQERVAAILAQPEMLNGAVFADLLGISTQALAEWRGQYKVLALASDKRGFRFPAWQITELGTLVPGLRDLHHALRDQPWLVYRFLTRHHPDLGDRTGIEALKNGDIRATIELARSESDTFS